MSLEQHALRWVDRGFRVFPCEPRDKTPCFALVPKDRGPDGKLVEGTAGFKKATREPEKISSWWRRIPNANIGLATGHGVFALDLDGPDAEIWFANACGRNGECPRTLTSRTSRGWHLFFKTAAEVPCSTSRLAPKVDIKGIGGYVIAPPSVHPDGPVYALRRDLPIAEAPRWLVDLAMPDEMPAPVLGQKPVLRLSLNGRARALEAIIGVVACAQAGKRNDLLFWGGIKVAEMAAAGFVSLGEAEACLIEGAAQTGLPAPEIKRTLASAFQRGGLSHG
jgi:Bifunctional DNA primase/polymerase, N-terminal